MSHHQPYDSLSSQNRSPFINALNNISSPSSHGGQSGQGTLNQMTVKCHNKNGMLTTSSLNQLLWFLNCDKGEQGFSIPVLKRSYNRSWSTTRKEPVYLLNNQWKSLLYYYYQYNFLNASPYYLGKSSLLQVARKTKHFRHKLKKIT